MRLERMNANNKKLFIDKFSDDELDTLSRLILDLNHDIKIHELYDLVEEMRKNINPKDSYKKIDIKYILRKFEYDELLTLDELLDIYSDESKYEREKYYVKLDLSNYRVLINQTQDFENLGFSAAVYYWESLSPQVRRWYADSCESNNEEITPEELFVYYKKINKIKNERIHL